MSEQIKLKEIASRIDAHLKRFEADKTINQPKAENRLSPYYRAGAYTAGIFVYVVYVCFQTSTAFKKKDALRYLNWLDAGNVGRHFKAFREMDNQPPASGDNKEE